MSESLLDGVLGGEEKKIDPTVSGAEPLAAAIATNLASQSPQVVIETVAFLRQQTNVLRLQEKNLEAEYDYFESEAGPRLLALRLRTGFQIFITLVATVVGLGVAIMIHDAVTSHRVIIDPFDIASNVSTQVPSGKIIAAGLLDELSRLQDATRSSVQKLDQSNGWSSEVRLEVPETGISLGDISRLLRERFGNDVHIDGDLIETPSGDFALTVRGHGVPPKTFSGPATELDKLTVQAAEYVYSKSQPARWAYYLQNAGRNEEAIAFCRTALGSASTDDRPYLLNVWANAIGATGGSIQEALALYRAALKLKPDYWIGYNNVMNALWIEGKEEEAWHAGEEMRKVAGGRPGRSPELYYQNWDTLTWNLGPWLAAELADAEANAGVGTATFTSGPAIADIQARLHDPQAADLALKTTREDPNDPTIGAMSHFVHGRLAAEAGDTPRAAAEMESFSTAYADPAVSSNYSGYNCWIAPAEEASGHPDKADALLKSAGTYVDCYRFRADILDGRGDWPGAQKSYAAAVALAPDLPAAYYSWGLALARHGDPAGAEAKLKDANVRGPHWADPLKAWGDVLAKQGKTKAALAKYNEALMYAPNWQQLKEAREAATKLKS